MLFHNQTCKSVLGSWGVSDRIHLVTLKAQSFDVSIIQVYAPTTESW